MMKGVDAGLTPNLRNTFRSWRHLIDHAGTVAMRLRRRCQQRVNSQVNLWGDAGTWVTDTWSGLNNTHFNGQLR